RHQITISSDLSTIQRDNQSLWNEMIVMREQYRRQQDTIDKIVRFLASVFESRGGSCSGGGAGTSGLSAAAGVGAAGFTANEVATVAAGLGFDFLGGGSGAGLSGLTAGGGGGNLGMGNVSSGGGMGGRDVGDLGDLILSPMMQQQQSKRRKLLTDGNEGPISSSVPIPPPALPPRNGSTAMMEEFLDLDSFYPMDSVGSGSGGNAGTGNASLKRTTVYPSHYPSSLFVAHPRATTNNTIATNTATAVNPSAAALQHVQNKAQDIQKEIDLLDDRLLSASALLGMDDVNIEELFGRTETAGSQLDSFGGGGNAVPGRSSLGPVAGTALGGTASTQSAQLQELDWL
ncbi:stress-responsive transcription factor hsf1, partial [Podochytrium sp. JEL0797]